MNSELFIRENPHLSVPTLAPFKTFTGGWQDETLRSPWLDDYSVFHVRLSDFELQVERMLDASLRTRPIAIISSNRQDGTIVSSSQEALSEGLFPGLKVSLARRMSHGAILLPYNSALYSQMHQYVYQTIAHYSPVIEPTVFGQYFADMSGMDGIYHDNLRAGSLMAKDIQSKVNLESRIGISANKLVSRIATAVVPETIHQVEPGSEQVFLSPLDSEHLPTTAEPSVNKIVKFLLLRQVKSVQEATAEPDAGEILFGKHYWRLFLEARGKDYSIVQPPQLRNHIIQQTVLTEDTNDETKLMAAVRNLAEQTAHQLRVRKQIARSLSVEIHYTDGLKNARKGSVAFNDDTTVVEEAIRLFLAANYRRNRVRAIVVDATRFQLLADQLDLFRSKKDDNLSLAIDCIRKKYGFSGIMSAAGLSISPKNTGIFFNRGERRERREKGEHSKIDFTDNLIPTFPLRYPDFTQSTQSTQSTRINRGVR
ncbi:MAG: hypothetical protein WC703_11320 [Candidatus Neomarinimicrobiota bacterium]